MQDDLCEQILLRLDRACSIKAKPLLEFTETDEWETSRFWSVLSGLWDDSTDSINSDGLTLRGAMIFLNPTVFRFAFLRLLSVAIRSHDAEGMMVAMEVAGTPLERGATTPPEQFSELTASDIQLVADVLKILATRFDREEVPGASRRVSLRAARNWKVFSDAADSANWSKTRRVR
jgi:hypothetical protein